jgi:hypothetical protein
VVGGRSFTSHILQRNCHEFIAYENLLKDKEDGDGGRAPRSARAPARPSAETRPLAAAFPNLQRAMKILAEREVAPQLGVLKSTLLQLDPTFSERDYGTGSFQEFMQKMKAARYVKLRRTERGYMVDLEVGESDKAARDPEVHPAPVDSSQPAAEAAPAQPVVTAPPAPTADRTEAMALLKGEQNKRRSDGRKRKPEMGPWRDVTFPDGSVVAEPPTVELVRIEHHDDERDDDQDAS